MERHTNDNDDRAPHEPEIEPSRIRPRDGADRESQGDREYLIVHGIESARHEKRDIDPMTARMIAHLLSPSDDSALAALARNGYGRNRDLRAEYLPIYEDPTTTGSVLEAIDWLGAHLVNKENLEPSRTQRPPGAPTLRNLLWQTEVQGDGPPLHVNVRADIPNERIDQLADRLQPKLDQHGTAFRAFLLLPDVEATSDDLEESYLDSFQGEFAERDQLIRAFTEIDEFAAQLREIRERYLGGEFVQVDMDGLWVQLNEVWDIVLIEDRYFVFNT